MRQPPASSLLVVLASSVSPGRLAVFFLYTGIEAATGTWTYSLFTEARAIPASTAGMLSS